MMSERVRGMLQTIGMALLAVGMIVFSAWLMG
jgi:hypothetical protein